EDLYVNTRARGSPHEDLTPKSDPTNQGDGVYSLLTISNMTAGQTGMKSCDSEEEIQYATVLHCGNRDGENQYDNIRRNQPGASTRCIDQNEENQSVIYSSVR
ncbi:hypothetical protein DNTS_031449, partial [Danionella cerebrum]